MFESLIEQAHSIIQRLHESAELGLDHVSEVTKVRPSELEAWDIAAHGIVALLFGANSAAWVRWRALTERRGVLIGEAGSRDIKRGDYFGLIDYFHLAIGALQEFEANYQYQRDTPAPAPPSSTLALVPSPPPAAPSPPPVAPSSPPAAPSPPPAPLPRVRTTDDGWELTLPLTDEAYDWLRAVVATREPARTGDSAAIVELAATIIERVARNSQRDMGAH